MNNLDDFKNAIKQMNYPDIVNYVSTEPGDKDLLFRIKCWYSEKMKQKKELITYEILNMVLIISMRKQTNRGRIPTNKYLDMTLNTMIANGVRDLDSAVNYFIDFILGYELMKNEKKEQLKKDYKTVAAHNKIKNKLQLKTIT